MKLRSWELSVGLYTGILFGYRQYIDQEENKIDHVLYIFLFDICLSLYYD